MTGDERCLLAVINRWRRSGLPAVPPHRGYEPPDRSARVDLPTWDDRFGRFDGDLEIRVWRPDHLGRWPTYATEYRVRTVGEGVDVLCALGILPPRFSSAFSDGVLAGGVVATQSFFDSVVKV